MLVSLTWFKKVASTNDKAASHPIQEWFTGARSSLDKFFDIPAVLSIICSMMLLNGKTVIKYIYIVKRHISHVYIKSKPTFFLSSELIASPAILKLANVMQLFGQRSSPWSMLSSSRCSNLTGRQRGVYNMIE